MKNWIFIISLIVANVSVADNKYPLTFQKQNHWVAQEDIKPIRDLIKHLNQKPQNLSAICSSKDRFCNQRIDILNLILRKQKTGSQVQESNISNKLNKNEMIITLKSLYSSEYDRYVLTFKDKSKKLEKNSKKKLKKILNKSDLKYLSQFKLVCNKLDSLCKKRFKNLNSKISKTLKFKYNFKISEDKSLNNNTVKLINYRHDYTFIKPKNLNKVSKIVKKDKPYIINKINSANIIVFPENTSLLLDSEKNKIRKIIKKNKTNTFNFSCQPLNRKLCQKRIHAIKNYALKHTKNIIEMYQINRKTDSNQVIITNKK